MLVVLGPSNSPKLCSHGPRRQCNSCASGPRSHLVFSTCILLRNTTWCQEVGCTCRKMASFRVEVPEKFNFSRQEDWPKWSRRFERFRQANELAKEEETSQINTLIYAMGDQADDILISFKLTEAQLKKYDVVKKVF